MSDLVPTPNGDSDSLFELADGWIAQRVPLSESPVPMADVIDSDNTGFDIFRQRRISEVFESMREQGIRLLRLQIGTGHCEDDELSKLPYLEFQPIEHERMSGEKTDKAGTKYPRNPEAKTAFIASEHMAQILVERFQHDILFVINGLSAEKQSYARAALAKMQDAYRQYREQCTDLARVSLTTEVNELIDSLRSTLHKKTYVGMMQGITADPSVSIVDQPHCRGQMTVFDNPLLLHRTVDRRDRELDFYSSNWHSDLSMDLGFLYPRHDGVLMGGFY